MQGGITSFNGAAEKPAALSREELYRSLSLVPVPRGGHRPHAESLVGRDVVHDFGTDSVENLERYRLGGAAFNRSCWAVRNKENQLQSAVYVHKEYTRIATPRLLSGNVRDILSSEAKENKAIPLSVIFYSICNIGETKGAGEILIAKVYEHMNKMYLGADTVFSTLSPLRQPRQGYGIDNVIEASGMPYWGALDDAAKRAVVLKFLLEKKEGVQRFHMGNGATIGDIKLDADRTDSGKYRVMVNYVYDRDPANLAGNRETFRMATTEEALMPLVSPFLRAETESAFSRLGRTMTPERQAGSQPAFTPSPAY